MLVSVDDPRLTEDLLRHLRCRIDVVAASVGDGQVLVGLLGSRSEASQRHELEARLAAWRREHPRAGVLVLADAA